MGVKALPEPEQDLLDGIPAVVEDVNESRGETQLYPSGTPQWWTALLVGLFTHWPVHKAVKVGESIAAKTTLWRALWLGRLSRKFHGKRQKMVRRDGLQMVENFAEHLLPQLVVEALEAESLAYSTELSAWKTGVWFRTYVLTLCVGSACFIAGVLS